MDGNLDAPLSPEEFASLKEVGKGLMMRTIPESHKDKLIRLGFVQQVLGGFKLTGTGQMRAAKGK